MTDSFDDLLGGQSAPEPDPLLSDNVASASGDGQRTPAVQEAPTLRDLQRAALRDLILLATESAATETDIERKRIAALEDVANRLIKGNFEAEKRFSKAKDAIAAKTTERIAKVDADYQSELGALKTAERRAREKVAAETRAPEADIRKKYEQATWLADSVLEATQDQARVDTHVAKKQYKEQIDELDVVEQQAMALLARFSVQSFEVPDANAPVAAPAASLAPAAVALADNAGPPATGTAGAEIPPAPASPAADPAASATPPTAPARKLTPEEAAAQYTAKREEVSARLDALSRLSLPNLFVGAKPYVFLLLLTIIAAAITQLAQGNLDLAIKPLSIAAGITFGSLIILGTALSMLGKSHVRKAFTPLAQSVYDTRRSAHALLESTLQTIQAKLTSATETRNAEIQEAKSKYTPQLARIKSIREAAVAAAAAQTKEGRARADARRSAALDEIEQWRQKHLAEYTRRHSAEKQAVVDRNAAMNADVLRKYSETRDSLGQRLRDGLVNIQAPIANNGDESASALATHVPIDWNDPIWQDYKPPRKFTELVRFGELRVDLKKIADSVPHSGALQLKMPDAFSMPSLLAFPRQASLLIQSNRQGRAEALRVLQMLMIRLLTSLPAGRVRFHIIDPVGLGQNFAGFMHLADYDDALVGVRILTDGEQIEKRLTDLTEHMETVIQKYLRNEFATIDEYNAQAGELAEPYRFLVIADFPVGFQGDSMRRLSSIVTSGARCGVYVLIARDTRQEDIGAAHLDDLESLCVNLVQDEEGRFIWKDDVFSQFPLTLDPPPSEEMLTRLCHIVGNAAKEAKRVELPFEAISPPTDKIWSSICSSELVVAIGRTGATRLQEMRIGKGVAQHCLIAGKTGSGKSTLLNILITNLALWFPPEEVEFYLIDFKKGVEFKAYATSHLPHARAIAVESDREFGISVLQQLDAELTHRGVLYRSLGTQDLAAYRAAAGPDAAPMPRTLLIIDEFQEFFSEDDKIAQEAALLLDRLIRQGRAFGMHVLLGSQTIGGASGMPRATLGQMAIRVALMCSEADSQLILGDNNAAARLLSRPGEAIYNDAGGSVENNSPFQVSWLSDETRERYLEIVHQRDLKRKRHPKDTNKPALVFEGNAPADLAQNELLKAALDTPTYSPVLAATTWLGDPVAIKDPTTITIRRQSGANVLILGQQEEGAMFTMAAMMIALAAQHAPGTVKFYIMDGSAADSPLAKVLPMVKSVLPHDVTIVEFRAVSGVFTELAAELAARQSGDSPGSTTVYTFIYALQRYRVLRKSGDDFGFSIGSADEEKPVAVDKQFGDLLKEGPSLGMHTITWADTMVSIDRTLDRSAMREFDNRVLFQMSANDSSNLIDSPAANKLGLHRALLYSEEQGLLEKFRPYAQPTPEFIESVKQRLSRKR